MDQSERRRFLIRKLLNEDAKLRDMEIPAEEEAQKPGQRNLQPVTVILLRS